MYYTYILQSKKDNRRYIGYSGELGKRLKAHNDGKVRSTAKRRPFRLICWRQWQSKIEAVRYEKYLKKLKGGQQLYLEIEKMNKMPL